MSAGLVVDLNPEKEPCALCGQVATGWAAAYNDTRRVRLCHDGVMSCYHRWTVWGERPL